MANCKGGSRTAPCNKPPAPCPACGGSGQLSSFKGESRFLLSVEECLLCCGTGFAPEEPQAAQPIDAPDQP
ncbi:hypothetical protein [Candidatus Electronema sp. JM]|uniref:hypothetical protein n=1 Tax=Candidatus Electronema sp. JM TaxID=3401571 RepID=UPI003AA83667